MIHKGEIIKLEDLRLILECAEQRIDEMEGTPNYHKYEAALTRIKKVLEP